MRRLAKMTPADQQIFLANVLTKFNSVADDDADDEEEEEEDEPPLLTQVARSHPRPSVHEEKVQEVRVTIDLTKDKASETIEAAISKGNAQRATIHRLQTDGFLTLKNEPVAMPVLEQPDEAQARHAHSNRSLLHSLSMNEARLSEADEPEYESDYREPDPRSEKAWSPEYYDPVALSEDEKLICLLLRRPHMRHICLNPQETQMLLAHVGMGRIAGVDNTQNSLRDAFGTDHAAPLWAATT